MGEIWGQRRRGGGRETVYGDEDKLCREEGGRAGLGTWGWGGGRGRSEGDSTPASYWPRVPVAAPGYQPVSSRGEAREGMFTACAVPGAPAPRDPRPRSLLPVRARLVGKGARGPARGASREEGKEDPRLAGGDGEVGAPQRCKTEAQGTPRRARHPAPISSEARHPGDRGDKPLQPASSPPGVTHRRPGRYAAAMVPARGAAGRPRGHRGAGEAARGKRAARELEACARAQGRDPGPGDPLPAPAGASPAAVPPNPLLPLEQGREPPPRPAPGLAPCT